MEVNQTKANKATHEIHAEQSDQKCSEAENLLDKHKIKPKRGTPEWAELRLSEAINKRKKQKEIAAAKAAKSKAKEEKKAAIWAAMPEERRQKIIAEREEVRRVIELGPQVLTGNLLHWTEGNSEAAHTSRYNQACRLKVQTLSRNELSEARFVIPSIRIWGKGEAKRKRLDVALLEVEQQLRRLDEAQRSAWEAKSEAKAKLPKLKGADKVLTASLAAAIEGARNKTGGYVYLKQWTLVDGTRWLKVGITNNPNRRDFEQNVLPVPAVTLRLMETQSMDQAAAIERALHQQLASQKVTGAGNRELFHLNDAQLAALMAAMSL